MQPLNTELILIRITGEDRPGLTASVTEILAKYDATILDIGQADIHNTLSLGILCKTEEQHSGFIMKELLFKASSLGVTVRFYPITAKEYEDWVNMQGKNRYILTLLSNWKEKSISSSVASFINCSCMAMRSFGVPRTENSMQARVRDSHSSSGIRPVRRLMASIFMPCSARIRVTADI